MMMMIHFILLRRRPQSVIALKRTSQRHQRSYFLCLLYPVVCAAHQLFRNAHQVPMLKRLQHQSRLLDQQVLLIPSRRDRLHRYQDDNLCRLLRHRRTFLQHPYLLLRYTISQTRRISRVPSLNEGTKRHHAVRNRRRNRRRGRVAGIRCGQSRLPTLRTSIPQPGGSECHYLDKGLALGRLRDRYLLVRGRRVRKLEKHCQGNEMDDFVFIWYTPVIPCSYFS
jgi:hypothetical protein